MSKILAFDTSNNSCSVAISDGLEVLAFEQELRPSMQAEVLMVLIESTLQTAKLKYHDLNYLAVTTGPGSFTGIRIGLAAAKGIIHATKIKGIGINCFEYAHYRLRQQIVGFDAAIIVINAYRDQQYIQIFDSSGQSRLEPLLLNNSEAYEVIANYAQQKETIACAGSGLAYLYTKLKHIKNLHILPRHSIIKANHLTRIANEKISQGKFGEIAPLYIRPPDAKIAKSIITD